MYLDHYKLTTKPFQITVDPKFLWLGEKHKEALATLRYGILDNRGFLLLTGEVGTGKTILINQLVSLLDIDTVVATLPDPDLESMDFYNLLADGLNMKRTFESKAAFLIHLRDFLYQSYAKNQQVLLIIDESQRLNHRLMEDIRVLSNIEMHDRKLINIFFVGQQEFNSILMTPQNRALAQRITVRYHIEPLDKKETGDYIHHRLKVAGATRKIFDNGAIDEVYQFSGGIPRLINIICDHALLTGYAQGVQKINSRIIQECAGELRIPAKMPVGGISTDTQKGPDQTRTANTGKDEAKAPATDENVVAAGKDEPEAAGGTAGKRPAVLTLIYAAVIIGIIGFSVYFLAQYQGEEKIQYNAEDLTPQKYKTSLEREKELLANRMKDAGTGAQGQAMENAPRSSSDETETSAATDQSVVNQGEPAQKKGADGPTGRTKTDQGPNNATVLADPAALAEKSASEIEPLPLMTEKIIVNFGINSNDIDENSFDILNKIAAYMVRHPAERIYVRGYTDSIGSESYNTSVSQFRANAVKSYLMGKGVKAENIITEAKGSANPIASNDSFEGRRQNRRVEVEFQHIPWADRNKQ